MQQSAATFQKIKLKSKLNNFLGNKHYQKVCKIIPPFFTKIKLLFMEEYQAINRQKFLFMIFWEKYGGNQRLKVKNHKLKPSIQQQ